MSVSGFLSSIHIPIRTPFSESVSMPASPLLRPSCLALALSLAPTAPTRCNSTFRMAYERLLKTMLMTSSFSRAWVHRAWMVYMAEPSPASAITLRSGQAMATPTALGRPWPMARC